MRRGHVRAVALPASLLILLGALAALGDRGAAARPELLVAAAADLVFPFREIGPAFERAHEVKVTLTFGSTGQLAQQIFHGAPFDVFFAANIAYLDELRAQRAILADSVEPYAQGQLVLATRQGRPPLTTLEDLGRGDVKRIAIANPAHAPYGVAAREALERAGLWAQLRPKLVYGENISQTLQFLQTRNVDAAIIALSVARAPEVHYATIDPSLYHPLIQAVAVTARSRHPELARAFVRFVNGPVGRPLMKRFGFLLPGEF